MKKFILILFVFMMTSTLANAETFKVLDVNGDTHYIRKSGNVCYNSDGESFRIISPPNYNMPRNNYNQQTASSYGYGQQAQIFVPPSPKPLYPVKLPY